MGRKKKETSGREVRICERVSSAAEQA